MPVMGVPTASAARTRRWRFGMGIIRVTTRSPWWKLLTRGRGTQFPVPESILPLRNRSHERHRSPMKPTIISKKASNWVDRGEPALPTLRRVLAHFFERFTPEDHEWLTEHAQTILGMLAADATEV